MTTTTKASPTIPTTLKKPIHWTDQGIRALTLDKLRDDYELGNPLCVARQLYLLLDRKGGPAKWWLFRFTSPEFGRKRDMGLGRYGKHADELSLKDARERAATLRKQVREGLDPIEERERLRTAMLASAGKVPTFSECSTKYIAAHSPSWKNAKHRDQWANTLRDYANPVVGALPVQLVATDHVLQILEPIWTTKTETAKRVQGRMEKVLDFAKSRGYRSGENPARWRGHLDTMLAKPTKIKKVKHHASLHFSEMYEFMQELKQKEGTVARALEFCILTATRTSEVIGAQWSEFDLQGNVWTIPPERMKAGVEHKVPLSKAAMDVLKAQKGQDETFVFPGVREGRQAATNSMLGLLKEMRSHLTVHGFRSSFRTWCAERTSFRSEVAEAALAHTNRNKVEAAYLHSDHLEERTALMKRWADHCLTKQTSKVTQLATA